MTPQQNYYSCIICQVKDSYEYLPAFLAYHSNLVDMIILIDHNSQKDLRSISSLNVQVFRARMGVFAQDITMNAVMFHLSIRTSYSWVFVLDVDEYLPFKNRDEINRFYLSHPNSKYVEFHWRNGIAKDRQVQKIASKTEFLFSDVLSSTHKLCYHTEKAGLFWLRAGNHFAMRPLPKIISKRFPPRTEKSKLGLFHIPFLNMPHLRRKFDSFPAVQFSNKIKRCASHLIVNYGQDWDEAQISDRDLLWLVTNYRTVGHTPLVDVEEVSFSAKYLFDHLGEGIAYWTNLLGECNETFESPPSQREKEVIDYLRQHKYRYGKKLAKHTQITGENEILIA